MALPFGPLKYLYVGVEDFPRTLDYYRNTLGGRLVWWFRAFDTEVAAVEVGDGPLVLLAEHRPAPSVLPIYVVDSLADTLRDLEGRGFTAKEGPFGIPDGDCYLFEDPSGNEVAFFEDQRPDALVAAYADPDSEGAVRPDGA